jgi:hypothetical protein
MTKCNLSNFFIYYSCETEEWMAIPRDNLSTFMNSYSLPSKDKDLNSLIKLIENGKAKR